MADLPPTFTPGFHDEATVRAMPYRPLGRDGRLVSLLSFGASSLSGSFRADTSEAESCAVVVAAIKAGINVIDTAAWYGHGESERILGRALKAVPRSAYYIHTKCVLCQNLLRDAQPARALTRSRSTEQMLPLPARRPRAV